MSEERERLLMGIEKLTAEVEELRERVDRLCAHVRLPEVSTEEKKKLLLHKGEDEGVSEELLNWAGKSALLPRLSAICFVLVIALILRTITDHGLLGQLPGALLGIAYASALIAVGWYKYRQNNFLAPVFACCGTILMYSIVAETQGHFEILPPIPAYFLLMATGAAMAFLSWRLQVALPILVGTVGMCLAGLMIDYPNPIFPLLAMLLLFANVLATLATRLKRCSWLRWLVLGMTLLMFQVWSFKIGIFLARNVEPSSAHALPWFLPILTLFGAVLVGISLLGILTSGEHQISRFDLALPTINVVWAFTAAYYVFFQKKEDLLGLGITAAALAIAHFGIAGWLGSRQREGAPGTNAYSMAGALLLTIALPMAFNYHLSTLPVLAFTAAGLAVVSHKWQSGGVRGTSYLLQLGAALILLQSTTGGNVQWLSWGGLLTAVLLSAAGFWHFHWCRQNSPPATSQLFARDRRDRSAVLLLLATLLNAFLAGRVLLYQWLGQGAGGAHAFACGQSVLINIGAALLLLLSLRLGNKELRNVALLITLLGGSKVFLSDLLSTQGFPLVVSVLSFGLLITLVPIVLSRWPRAAAAPLLGEKGLLPSANGPAPH